MADKKRIKAKRRRRRFIVFLMLLFLIFAGIKIFSKVKPILSSQDIIFKKEGTIEFGKETEINKDFIVKPIANNYIGKYENNTLSLFNKNGEIVWEKKLNISQPILNSKGEIIIAADSLKGEIYYLDLNGDVKGSFSIKGSIYDIKVNNSNCTLVASGDENKIVVLNDNCEEISNITIPKGHIIDCELSDNNNIVISLLTIEEDRLYSNILFYSLDGRILAGNKYKDAIICKLCSVNNDKIMALGDNTVLMATSEEGVMWKEDMKDTINTGDISDKGLIALNLIKERNIIIDTKNRSVITLIDDNGKVISETSMAEDLTGIDMGEDKIVAFTDRTMYLINNNGNIAAEKKINRDIKDVFWISDDYLAVVYNDEMDILGFSN